VVIRKRKKRGLKKQKFEFIYSVQSTPYSVLCRAMVKRHGVAWRGVLGDRGTIRHTGSDGGITLVRGVGDGPPVEYQTKRVLSANEQKH
jgi:hypothetical protein